MVHPVVAAFRRNTWATARMINFCAWQPPAPAAGAEAPSDVYGAIEPTLNHILGAESRYLGLLGAPPADPVSEKQPRQVAALLEPNRALGEAWQALLGTDRDVEEIKVRERPNGREEMPDWLLLAQCVHHGDDHRAQIGTLLGRAGRITPEHDAWTFGFEPAAPAEPPGWADALLRRLFGHHAWATRVLLESCRTLSPEQLALTAEGTYGTVLATLDHLVSSDRGYLSRLRAAGRLGQIGATGPEELLRHWEAQAEGWTAYLDSRPDFDAPVECSDGWYPAWIVALQAIHHGNDHRTHLGTILLAHGLEAPDLDVWSYAWAEGLLRDLG